MGISTHKRGQIGRIWGAEVSLSVSRRRQNPYSLHTRAHIAQ